MLIDPDDLDAVETGGSSTSNSLSASSTAVLTVCQEAANAAATRAIEILSITRLFNAHFTACRVSFILGAAAV